MQQTRHSGAESKLYIPSTLKTQQEKLLIFISHIYDCLIRYFCTFHCSNVSIRPIIAMGCQQCLSLSVVQLKDKHCRKPHCRNGALDMLGMGRYKCQICTDSFCVADIIIFFLILGIYNFDRGLLSFLFLLRILWGILSLQRGKNLQ